MNAASTPPPRKRAAKTAPGPHQATPPGDDSRRRILDATIEIASERGYEGTSIALVSKRSGLPVGSIYWHFANKDALLAAVVERSYHQWRAGQQPQATTWSKSHGKPLADLLTATLLASPEFLRLGLMLTLERRPVEATAREAFLRFRTESLERMVEVFERAVAETGPGRDPMLGRRLAELTVAVADGLFVACQADPEQLEVAAVIDLYVDAVDLLLTGDPGRRRSR